MTYEETIEKLEEGKAQGKSFDEILPQDQGRSFGGGDQDGNFFDDEEYIEEMGEQEYLICFGSLPINQI